MSVAAGRPLAGFSLPVVAGMGGVLPSARWTVQEGMRSGLPHEVRELAVGQGHDSTLPLNAGQQVHHLIVPGLPVVVVQRAGVRACPPAVEVVPVL